MPAAITPIGTTIKWNAAVVLNAKSIQVNYGTLGFIRDSDLAGAAETVLPTNRGRGSVTFEYNHDPDDTVHQALATDFLAKTTRAVVVTLADAIPTTLTGNGYIETLTGPNVDQGNPVRVSCTVQLTDDWVRA